jgi:uncharacterized protein HemY
VRRNLLLFDVAVALALAGLVLILAPGLAVVAIVAVVALVVCGVSFAVGRWRRRRARRRGAALRRRPVARR